MRRTLLTLLALAVLGAAAVLFVTRPSPLPPEVTAGLTGDAARGETVFWAGGCASCHAAPGAEGEDRLVLAGGHRLVSDFGTFVAPNISPGPEGIGGWSLAEFASALTRGVSPGGQHYYPAFPYGSYARMEMQDLADLKAFMDGLPASDSASLPHDLGFPFTLRAGLGLWKAAAGESTWVLEGDLDPEVLRGRYLSEALAHCGECHTPRNALGVLDRTRWMAGAPNPSGEGRIPGLTPDQFDWSADDIAYYLETGFTPDFDSVGGTMASVVRNMGNLSAEDRQAIAAYVKALRPAN